MRLTFAVIASAASLALVPVGAIAQHVDVGPGGVAVHGDRHEERREVVREHHDDHPVVREHHDDHHDDHHEGSRTTVIERH